MPRSPPSSPRSASCRLDWRPSRWPLVALLLLAVAAPGAVLASAIPEVPRRPLAGLVGLWALVLARREQRVPSCTLEWRGGDAPARLRTSGTGGRGTIATTLHAVQVEFRGPLVRLLGRDDAGHTRRLVWWPDTLPPAARRRLVLAARGGPSPDNPLSSMAA